MRWVETRLRSAADVVVGRQRNPGKDTGPHMIPYLRAANVGPGRLLLDDVKEMDFSPQEQAIFRLRPGDLLITEGSGSRASVGASTVWDDELPGPVCFQNTLLRARPRSGIDARFLYWWCQHAHGSGLFASVAGGANIFHLSAERVRTMPIVIPPLDEQRRVADFLDDSSTNANALADGRTRQRDALTVWLTSALEGVYRWRQSVALKRKWSVIDCKHRTPDYLLDGYPVVSPGDTTPGRLDLSRCHRFVGERDFQDLADAARRCRRGDIVYSRNASVGIASYVDSDRPFTMGQDVCKITSVHQSQLFLTHFLNFPARRQLAAMQIGSTFSRVNVASILELRVPDCSPDEQSRIAGRADAIVDANARTFDAVTAAERVLAERQRALITAAVTGELDVTTAGRSFVLSG